VDDQRNLPGCASRLQNEPGTENRQRGRQTQSDDSCPSAGKSGQEKADGRNRNHKLVERGLLADKRRVLEEDFASAAPPEEAEKKPVQEMEGMENIEYDK